MPIKPILLTAAVICSSLCAQAQYQVLVKSEYAEAPAGQSATIQSFTDYEHTYGRSSNVVMGVYSHDNNKTYSYVWDPATQTNQLKQTAKSTQTFDTDGDLLVSTKYNLDDKGGLKIHNRTTYTYITIAQKKLPDTATEELYNVYHKQLENYERTITHYDANGRFTDKTVQSFYIKWAWYDIRHDTAFYDANGNKEREVLWNYDNDGNVIDNYTTFYRYDAANRILADSIGPALYTLYKYNNAGILAGKVRYWYAGVTESSYDTAGRLIQAVTSIQIQGPPPHTATETDTYEYNQFGNCINHAHYAYNSTFDAYYYTPIWPTGISEATSNTLQLSLYPSPAVNSINITLELKTAQDINAAITTADGRLIKRWSDNKTQQYSKNISVMDLAAGTYYLTINAGGERAQKSFVVVR